MSSILRVDVLAIAPELSTLSDAAWVEILAYANAMSDVAFDGDVTSYRMARLFLCAHAGTMSKRAASGATGAVIREAAGGLQRTYAAPTPAATTSELAGTMYGKQYLAILGASGAHGPFLI